MLSYISRGTKISGNNKQNKILLLNSENVIVLAVQVEQC